MKFHLVGIGGAGMSVVADLLLAHGHELSGSDRENSENLERLAGCGVKTYVGHAAIQVPIDAVLVVSSAIKTDNPELQIAEQRGQEIWHRSQALAFAARSRDFIAVAGAHGKTSTTGMLAVAFATLGLDPSRAIGGNLADGSSGGYLGTGSMLVAEADESDGSFLHYHPRVALVTNIEPDHLDHYGNAENFAQAFVKFAQNIVPNGLLVACSDDPGARNLALSALELGVRVHTYGFAEFAPNENYHALLTMPEDLENERAVWVNFGTQRTLIKLQVPGRHMLLNAAGAWLTGIELGVDREFMAQGLAAFAGTGRRFELHGVVNEVQVYDDYAHHPTEIIATLETARKLPHKRLLVLFQPHLYSRTTNFKERFAEALSLADKVVITGAYAAREEPSAGDDGDVIAALMPEARFIAQMEQAAKEIVQVAQAGDLIFTIGAGDITRMAPWILRELGEKFAASA